MVPVCVCVGSYRCFIVPGTGYVKERVQKDVCVCVCVEGLRSKSRRESKCTWMYCTAVGGCSGWMQWVDV